MIEVHFRAVANLSIGALLAFVTTLLFAFPVGQKMDLPILRAYFNYRGPRPPPSDVVIVSIDDYSYANFQASTNVPLPRRIIADALEKINSASPRLVILDAKLPDERSPNPGDDDRIVNALSAGPTTIWSGEKPQSDVLIPSGRRFREAAKMEISMLISRLGSTAVFMRVDSDPDATRDNAVPLARPLVHLAGIAVELPGALDWINYYGPPKTITRIPIYDLVQPALDSTKLHDKIVLLGYQSAYYAKDDGFITPTTTADMEDDITGGMFGVEVHATIVSNLLDHSWLKRSLPFTEMLRLLVSACVIAFVGLRPESWRGALLAVLLLLFTSIAASYWAFSAYNFWMAGIGLLVPFCLAVVLVKLAIDYIFTHARIRAAHRNTGMPLS